MPAHTSKPNDVSWLPPVYAITDKRLAAKDSHLAIIKELVRGGCTLVQVRDKETPLGPLLEDLRRCADFCRARNVVFIVNDRCDLALIIGASGVHLGQEDLPPGAARGLLGPDRIIGFSTNTLLHVRRSASMPVQYIGHGPIFPTTTRKNPSPVIGIEGLRAICPRSPWPVVAIGGIGPDTLRDVLDAGARSAAVISSLMEARSIARQMERLLRIASE